MNSIEVNGATQDKVDAVSDRIARSRVPTWKRVLDCTLIIITAPVWLPLGVLIAVWIKLVSPGPFFFRQERIGHMGSRFLCWKFRTMKVNADTGVHRAHLQDLMTSNRPMKKLDSTGDSRLIPGGLALRSLGVDELPQLINVVLGEMSLVGPRPSTAYEYELFQPRHRRRCETLPGLTGLWQVSGKNRTTFEKMMELDVHYIETKTLFLDCKIIVSTPIAIIRQVWDVRVSRTASKQMSSEHTGVMVRLNHGGSQRATAILDGTPSPAREPVLAKAHRTVLRATVPGAPEV